MDSCYKNDETVSCSVFVDDNSPEDLNIVNEVLGRRSFADSFIISYDSNIKQRENWFLFRRFLELDAILQKYDSVLLMDADALVRQKLDWNIFGDKSIGIKIGFIKSSGYFSCAEGCIHIHNDDIGNSFVRIFREKYDSYNGATEGELVRRSIAYATSMPNFTNMDVYAIPSSYANFQMSENSAIWLPLRDWKYSMKFKREQLIYTNEKDAHFLDDIVPNKWKRGDKKLKRC